MKDLFLLYFSKEALNVFDKSQEKLHDPENKVDDGGERKKKAISQNRLNALKKRAKKLLKKLILA